MSTCVVVFPHQLFWPHPAIARSRPVVIVEDSLFFGDRHWPLRFHKQKLALHRASIRAYAARLRANGYDVDVLAYDPCHTLREQLGPWLSARSIDTIHCCAPEDDVLARRLHRLCNALQIRAHILPSPMFLDTVEDSPPATTPAGNYLMARFYTLQRRKLGILVEGDKPVGGAWSFDADNRLKWPAGRDAPPRWEPAPDPATRVVIAEIAHAFPDNPGSLASFAWPVTHAEAERQLDDFLQYRFRDFGPYEDALSGTARVMHHSLLTPALNIGLLTPRQVIDRALQAAVEFKVPLNSLEGFVRQIIGWREFMRIVYAREGTRQRNANFFHHTRPMPAAFYNATTGLFPADCVIRRCLEHAYAHHIERLMVLGSLMLLCRIHPTDIYRWFMELFIDAYDWVMVPNVYGMSQFADGGLITTKPYICGSNYLRKMSDYPRGAWCDTWDALFWSFIDLHRDFFAGQPRLTMMVCQLDRMSAARRAAHHQRAEAFLERLA